MSADPNTPPTASARPLLQFSLAKLLVFVTVCAVVMGVIRIDQPPLAFATAFLLYMTTLIACPILERRALSIIDVALLALMVTFISAFIFLLLGSFAAVCIRVYDVGDIRGAVAADKLLLTVWLVSVLTGIWMYRRLLAHLPTKPIARLNVPGPHDESGSLPQP